MPRKACLVGIGQTKVGRLPGKSSLQLQVEAAKLALEDAGLTKQEVNGIVNAYTRTDNYLMPCLVLGEHLGIASDYAFTGTMRGMSGCEMVLNAVFAVEHNLADVVLVAGGENRLSGLTRDVAVEALASIGHPEFESPYGPLIPAFYALLARRHMRLYGTTEEQMAQVAVACRKHAALNPYAHFYTSLTVQDVLNSLPCCFSVETSWLLPHFRRGGALIITTEERARGLRKPLVYLLGFREGRTQEHLVAFEDLTLTACKRSGARALQMAGIRLEEINVAELYDCFHRYRAFGTGGPGFLC